MANVNAEIQAEVAAIRGSGLLLPEWYLPRHTDIPAGDDGVLHFCRRGWQTGAAPNQYFNTEYYLMHQQDVAASGLNPLLHYLAAGEAEGRNPSPFFHAAWYRETYGITGQENGLAHFLARRFSGEVSPVPIFDPAWYLENNPDVAAAGADPFEHFLAFGPSEGRDPAPGFDIKFYLNRYGHQLKGENPLLHYIAHQDDAAFQPVRPAHERLIPGAVRAATRAAPEFEPFRPLPRNAAPKARLLAFYLPQFHQIPENDAWWGEGFTDWTNLSRALPRFAGHLQPRVPRDLGFYSLDDPKTLRRQIDMAVGAGLAGFIFYFYWFNGQRLLQKPLEQLRGDKSLDFPFAVMWANENWTRRWDGLEREVLISQEYRERDDEALVAAFAALFADARYIRVAGRPLLMIYRADLIPDAARRIAQWRVLFHDRHGEDPVIILAQSLGAHDPAPFGLDGAIEFPPHKLSPEATRLNDTLDLLDPDFAAAVYDYQDIAAISLALPPPDFPLIKTLVPGWDNDPRREGQGLVLHRSSPAAYRAWLENLIAYTEKNRFFGERLIAVNAWNEWAEGAFLEPDLHFGAAYLNATGRALCDHNPAALTAGILLVGHDAHPHGAQLLLLHVARHLRRRWGMKIHILLLGVGPLLGKYYQEGEVTIAYDKTIIGNHLDKYRDAGIRCAIVNSAASSRVVPWLAQRGIAPTLLIHEMPRLLKEYNLEVVTRIAMATARCTVFSSAFVKDQVTAALKLKGGDAAILAQGNYQDIKFDRAARQKTRRALGIGADDFLILGVGFADFRKGFDLFMQLARHFAQSRPAGSAKLHFLWAGDIHFTLETYLRPEMDALGAAGIFHHIPFTETIAPYYSACDIYALTSREDPFPTTVIEALAAGTPCVAFEGTGGIPAMLREAKAGTVVPANDAAAFAAAITASLDHGALQAGRKKLGARAVRQFDFPVYVDRLLRHAQPKLLTISAAVLNYNYANYLPGRLGSVFAQTYPVQEILFLDDASQDNSLEVAKTLAAAAQRDITVIANEKNAGSIFAQWRRAAEAATGDYIWIAEADDECAPQFLERLAEAMAAADAPVLAFTDSRAIDETGAVTMRSYKPYYFESGAAGLARSGIWPAHGFARDFLFQRNLILNVSAVLWRRSALLAALAACKETLHSWGLAGDWRLYLEVLANQPGSVVYIADPLNSHRRHSGGVTQTLEPKHHLAEIKRIHEIAARKMQLDAAARARQSDYAQRIEAQFNLKDALKDAPKDASAGGPARKARTGRAIVAMRQKV